MLNNCVNTKKQGDIGLGVAIGWFAKKGYTVSIPLTDSQEYDLVVDINNSLKRIQIKTTQYKRDGNYSVSLTTKGGNKSGTGKIKKFDKELVDILWILTNDKEVYLLPTKNVKSTSSITLSSKYDEYRCEY